MYKYINMMGKAFVWEPVTFVEEAFRFFVPCKVGKVVGVLDISDGYHG